MSHAIPSWPLRGGLAVVLVSLFAAPMTGHAVQAKTIFAMMPAVGACKTALPVFETQVRKNPRGIANESGSTVFVSCVLTKLGDDLYTGDFSFEKVESTAAMPVTCTAVSPGDGSGPRYSVKSVDLNNDNGVVKRLEWTAADFNVQPMFDPVPGQTFSVSCALPPGTRLSFVRMVAVELIDQ